MIPPTPHPPPPPPAAGPAEAGRPSHLAGWPCRRQPDAGAVRQNGGRQHHHETLDGGDLCAFNRQREAVVQVEVTSFSLSSLPPLSLLLTAAKVNWCGMGVWSPIAGLLLDLLIRLDLF